MKSLLSSLTRKLALIQMAGLPVVFSVLTYIGSDALLYHFVDGRLLGLAETLAKIVEQSPSIIENSGESVARTAEVGRNKREQHELQDMPHSLRVFSSDGRLVWQSPNAMAQQPVSDHALD